jgi:hypothetical protein
MIEAFEGCEKNIIIQYCLPVVLKKSVYVRKNKLETGS